LNLEKSVFQQDFYYKMSNIHSIQQKNKIMRDANKCYDKKFMVLKHSSERGYETLYCYASGAPLWQLEYVSRIRRIEITLATIFTLLRLEVREKDGI
jgi:hypothetical protein